MLNRRSFVAGTGLALVAPTAFAGTTVKTINYSPGFIESALADGKTLFVDYAASWCSTCARQERIVSKLRREDPSYSQAMTFVRVDWDSYARHAVTKSRNVPRRSTLLVLKGDEELGRLVAETRENQIKALMDLGRSAATS